MVIKNSKRSGGPRTAEGKLSVSQNALKTGAYSNLAVLPNENPEEFNQIVEQFKHDFHPADVIESSLVHELASLTWKKLRLEKLEQAVFVKKLNAPITMEELIDCGLKFDQDRYDFWTRLTKLEDDVVKNAEDTLALIKPNMRVGISEELLIEIKALNPKIHEAVIDYYRQVEPLADVEISDWDLVSKTLRYNKQPEQFLTSLVFQRYVQFYEAGIWCTKNHDKINDAIEQIKQERLLNLMQSGGLLRANDDLSRSVIRTLSEFRKHHEWRIKNRVVDARGE
jgi:hypothetical protein